MSKTLDKGLPLATKYAAWSSLRVDEAPDRLIYASHTCAQGQAARMQDNMARPSTIQPKLGSKGFQRKVKHAFKPRLDRAMAQRVLV